MSLVLYVFLFFRLCYSRSVVLSYLFIQRSHIYLLTFAYVLVRLFIQSVFVELLVVYILLWIPSGVFYDDFPLLSPTVQCRECGRHCERIS